MGLFSIIQRTLLNNPAPIAGAKNSIHSMRAAERCPHAFSVVSHWRRHHAQMSALLGFKPENHVQTGRVSWPSSTSLTRSPTKLGSNRPREAAFWWEMRSISYEEAAFCPETGGFSSKNAANLMEIAARLRPARAGLRRASSQARGKTSEKTGRANGGGLAVWKWSMLCREVGGFWWGWREVS
jgi:hypothetical protein